MEETPECLEKTSDLPQVTEINKLLQHCVVNNVYYKLAFTSKIVCKK
jgi:hypothetical protein